MDMSLNLRAIVSQRLLPTVDGSARVPAVEIMLNTPYISELINKGEVGSIKDAMKESTDPGTITFDKALIKLYKDGKITLDEALQNADSRNDLSLAIRLGEGSMDNDDDDELILN
jgi:twitching motility protein PilU